MTKEEQVIKYYVLCNKLKNIIRTGWKNWHVQRNRLESVAEHIYSTQMLAIAMYNTYNYDIDFFKCILMIAIHEIEEIFIGDFNIFEITKEEKNKIGHKAVHEMFSEILPANTLEELILEHDERKTKEAMFVYQCDKLDCDLMSKIYDEEGCIKYDNKGHIALIHTINNETANIPEVNKYLNDNMTWSEMWMNYGLDSYPYDENFKSVSSYAKDNDITVKRK